MIGKVVLTTAGRDSASGTVTVGPDEPVFDGHYPGFPVLPGVYLVELVRGTLTAWLGGIGPLIAVERSRFHNPIRPGERITATLSMTWHASTELVCTAEVHGQEGKAADLRLRFQPAEHR